MNSILGLTNFLLDTQLTGEQSDCLHTIHDSAETLLCIINDVLDFSKMESNKMSLEPIPFDLLVAIEEVLDLLAQRAEKELILMFHYSIDDKLNFIGDVGRIRQVLMNVICNAIKFTSIGHVLVKAEIAQRVDGKVQIRIAVEDTGVGIPQEKVPLLFSQFQQLDSSTTRKFGGTGLGLAISKRLVEMMEGTISVESEYMKGSTFTITIWLPIAPNQKTTYLTPVKGLRILVVDVLQLRLSILEEQLTAWELNPTTTTSCDEVIDILLHGFQTGNPFKVVLMNKVLGSCWDGEDLALEIKDHKELADLKMILISSANQHPSKNVAFEQRLNEPIRWTLLKSSLIKMFGSPEKVVSKSLCQNSGVAFNNLQVLLGNSLGKLSINYLFT